MRRCQTSCAWVLLAASAALLTGCPVSQPAPPGPTQHLKDARTGADYWLYVPTRYDDTRQWPLVVTLHGTFGWDGPRRQVAEWGALAEEREFLVVAPELKSVQGLLPIVESAWFKDLEQDERNTLAIIDDVCRRYPAVDRNAILLTGFSAGGYPLYYIGLRNPTRFNMLIARDCNSNIAIFERIGVTDEIRKMPIVIFWGTSDLQPIQDQSWAAYRWLRRHECFQTRREEIAGGHLRRPDIAYKLWAARLPPRYRN